MSRKTTKNQVLDVPSLMIQTSPRPDSRKLVLLVNFNYLCTMKEEVKLHIYKPDLSTELELPYADGGIKAGFS